MCIIIAMRGICNILSQASFSLHAVHVAFTPGGALGAMMDVEEIGIVDDESVDCEDDGEYMSDDGDAYDLPLESNTPSKDISINLAECFHTPMRVASPVKPRKDDYDDVLGQISLGQLMGTSETTPTTRSETSSSSPVAGFLTLKEVLQWHPNRLWAVMWQNILVHSFPKENQRLTSKQSDWRRYLNGLGDPMTNKIPLPTSARQRGRARDVFRGVLSKVTGETWRSVAKSSNAMWAKCGENDFYRWWALVCAGNEDPRIARRIGSQRGRGKAVVKGFEETMDTETSPVPAGKVYEGCTGIMLTYNIALGLKSPEVLQMVQDKATPSDFIKHFEKSTFHKKAFEHFWEFLVELAAKLRFSTVGANMELSENAKEPGRVHCHGYVGTGIKGGAGSMTSVVRSDIREEDLVYMGVKPYPRPTKPKKNHPKTVCDAVVNGLYYVIANKTTTIFRKATVWHIEDCGNCLR